MSNLPDADQPVLHGELFEVAAAVEANLTMVRDRLDGQEELVATLMTAYFEMWACVDVIMRQMMGTFTDDQQQAFFKDVSGVREKMLRNLSEMSDGGLGDVSEDLRESVESLVRDQPAPPSG